MHGYTVCQEQHLDKVASCTWDSHLESLHALQLACNEVVSRDLSQFPVVFICTAPVHALRGLICCMGMTVQRSQQFVQSLLASSVLPSACRSDERRHTELLLQYACRAGSLIFTLTVYSRCALDGMPLLPLRPHSCRSTCTFYYTKVTEAQQTHFTPQQSGKLQKASTCVPNIYHTLTCIWYTASTSTRPPHFAAFTTYSPTPS